MENVEWIGVLRSKARTGDEKLWLACWREMAKPTLWPLPQACCRGDLGVDGTLRESKGGLQDGLGWGAVFVEMGQFRRWNGSEELSTLA